MTAPARSFRKTLALEDEIEAFGKSVHLHGLRQRSSVQNGILST